MKKSNNRFPVFLIIILVIIVLGIILFLNSSYWNESPLFGPERVYEAFGEVGVSFQCSDGIDNDGDGAIDYPEDFSCSSARDNDETNPKAQCQDGIDNDRDRLIDFPRDLGCENNQDDDESSECFNATWVSQLDGYFGEDTENPKWVWLINGIETNSQTNIISSSDLQGPIIGVGNKFIATDLNDDILRNRGDSWNFPNDYLKLEYGGTNDYSHQANNFPKENILVRYFNSFDTTRTVGVPNELQPYLKRDAKVVTIDAYNQEQVPSIFFSWQLHHDHSYIPGFWEGNGEEGYWYYLIINDVLDNRAVDASIHRTHYVNGRGEYPSERMQDFLIPERGEIEYRRHKFYNYISKYYPNQEERWREWSIFYVHDVNQSRSSITPTKRAVFQTIIYNGTVTYLPFYIDYDTGILNYVNLYGGVRNYARGLYFANEYFYSWSQYVASIDSINKDFIIKLGNWLSWPNGPFQETLTAKFGYDESGEIFGLGDYPRRAESGEFVYEEIPNFRENLGLLTGKYKTSYGIDIDYPYSNSQNFDGVKYDIPPNKDYAVLRIRNPDGYVYGGWVELGRNIFTNVKYWGIPWDLNYINNFRGLKAGNVTFNGNLIQYHESLVSGNKTPAVATYFHNNISHDDRIQDSVFVWTNAAVNEEGYSTNGMKYIFAFDDPIDLTTLSEENPLNIEFLGDKLKFIGYRNENGKDWLLVEKNNCIIPEPRGFCTRNEECDDGLYCTIDRCIDNQCERPQRDCNDGNFCTSEYCDEEFDTCRYEETICPDPTPDDCTRNVCNVERQQCEWDVRDCCDSDDDCPNGEFCCQGGPMSAIGGRICTERPCNP